MAIRTFMLTNTKGEEWNLNSLDSFLRDISGLGFKYKYDFETVGNTYVEVSEELQRPEPKGTINFIDYAKYKDFVKFAQSKPLTLVYTMPNVSETFYLKVKIAEMKKGEMEVGHLPCDIELIGIGNYYRLVSAENMASTDGKRYSYTYPYTYSNNAAGTVTLQSDTNLDSPTKITIIGPCTNPSWTHYVDGVITTTGKVNCEIEEGHRLVIDTTSIPYSIKEYDGSLNVIDDCYGESDFSTDRFVLLKLGENKIGFSHEGTSDLHVIVESRLSYESV